MDLHLEMYRRELLSVGPISATNTLAVLPLGRRTRQKLVVGDDAGRVSGFQIKKGEVVSIVLGEGRHAITAMALGGAEGNKNKVFVSCGPTIYGISRKGKRFFSFATNAANVLHSMVVDDTRVWAAAGPVLRVYDEGQARQRFRGALCTDWGAQSGYRGSAHDPF